MDFSKSLDAYGVIYKPPLYYFPDPRRGSQNLFYLRIADGQVLQHTPFITYRSFFVSAIDLSACFGQISCRMTRRRPPVDTATFFWLAEGHTVFRRYTFACMPVSRGCAAVACGGPYTRVQQQPTNKLCGLAVRQQDSRLNVDSESANLLRFHSNTYPHLCVRA